MFVWLNFTVAALDFVYLQIEFDNCKKNLTISFQMDHNVIVSDYAAMDRVLKEERQYILNIVKQIKKAGCNVLLIQKSILRYVNSQRN